MLKGPNSVLYGSNAMHGVVNVISKDTINSAPELGLIMARLVILERAWLAAAVSITLAPRQPLATTVVTEKGKRLTTKTEPKTPIPRQACLPLLGSPTLTLIKTPQATLPALIATKIRGRQGQRKPRSLS